MAGKSLVAEIESLHDDARSGEKSKSDVAYPLFFSFEDQDVFKDVTRVIFSYIEKQNGFSSNDRSKIRTFVRIFISLFFHVDDVVPEGMQIESDEGEEATTDEEDENQSVNTEDSEAETAQSSRDRSRSPSTGARRRNGRSRGDEADATSDLLRDVLTRNSKSTSADDNDTVNSADTPTASRDFSITPAPDDDDEDSEDQRAPQMEPKDEDKAIKTEETSGDERSMPDTTMEETGNSTPQEASDQSKSPEASVKEEREVKESNTPVPEENRLFAAAAAATAPGVHKRTIYSFFCNTAFYCFFRLYQVAYERLLKMKKLDAEMKADPEKGKTLNKVAQELGLYTTRFDDIDLSSGYYNALLELIDRFFDGDLDQAMFEEKTRYLFVTEAHVLFTIDKLVHSIIKQIQLVSADEKCVELVELFRSDQMLDSTCPRIVSVYRLRAEEIVGSEENLYKAKFNTDTHEMTIQLLDKDDDMLEPSQQDHYENYVASYMDWANSTDGIDTSKMQSSFLRRNWKPHDRHLNKIFVRSRLQYKISQENYHMYYIIGSEDVFVRPSITPSQDSSTERTKKWHNWLESRTTGWSRNIENDDTCKTMETEARKRLAE